MTNLFFNDKNAFGASYFFCWNYAWKLGVQPIHKCLWYVPLDIYSYRCNITWSKQHDSCNKLFINEWTTCGHATVNKQAKMNYIPLQFCAKVMIGKLDEILWKSVIFREEQIFGKIWPASIVSELAKFPRRWAKFHLTNLLKVVKFWTKFG